MIAARTAQTGLPLGLQLPQVLKYILLEAEEELGTRQAW